MKAIVFKPPKKVENPDNLPSVFLAGAIDMGSAVDWQKDVTEYLNDVPCVILNPRRDDWDSSWVQSIDNDQFRGQVEWELDGMEGATVVAMCLPIGSTAPISLLELGLHASDGKMLIFCPEGFYRKGNVEVVCKRYGVTVYDQFDEFKAAVKVRLSHSKAKTAAADSKTHKNFSNKRDALKFLDDHALMSVGWPEGQGWKEACYWNGKIHTTKADRDQEGNPLESSRQANIPVETKVASREMLRAFVTGLRYQNKPHLEIPQFPIQGKMELQSYQKKVTCHMCGQEMITHDPRRYPSHKDKNGEMCKESGWKIPQYPTQNSRIAAKTYWHGSDNPDVTIFKTDPEMFSLLGEGVYFYKNKFSAQGKGQYLYRVVVPPSLKIAPLNYRFSDDDVSMIFSRLLIQEKPGRYMGESSFLWWATDGYNLYPMSSHFNRTNLVKLLRSFMLSKGFSGMLANYPNGGEVLVLWDGYQGLRPENVETRQGASMNIAQELVKVAREVTSDNTGLALDGMSNVKAKKTVNRILEPLTKGFFTDTSWEPVQAIWTALSKANINHVMTKAEYTRGRPGQDITDSMHNTGKEWKFEVYFTNDKGRHIILYGHVRASWAGSVADPSDRYDLVAYVS